VLLVNQLLGSSLSAIRGIACGKLLEEMLKFMINGLLLGLGHALPPSFSYV